MIVGYKEVLQGVEFVLAFDVFFCISIQFSWEDIRICMPLVLRFLRESREFIPVDMCCKLRSAEVGRAPL